MKTPKLYLFKRSINSDNKNCENVGNVEVAQDTPTGSFWGAANVGNHSSILFNVPRLSHVTVLLDFYVYLILK